MNRISIVMYPVKWMLSLADFFGILTHSLINSHVRDGSRHLDCYRASFYNDALLYMGKALVQGARGRLRASRSPRKIGGTYLVNQGRRLIASVFPSSRFLPFDSKHDSNIRQAFKMIVKEVGRVSGQ